MPSGGGGTVSGCVMDPSAPLATAEFLVVDTETNGLGGERCELTEIGAVLVGGGELHDRWDTLVAAPTPLSRGIQRFTGITQAMVDQAPRAEDVLPELAAPDARARAGCALRGVRPARAAPGVRAGGPRVAGAAGPVHGRARPALRAARAPAPARPRWRARSGSTSRSSTARCPTPRRARACSARCSPRLCARGDDDRGGAGGDAPGAPAPCARRRHRRRALAARRAQAPARRQRAARRAGRLHLPQRVGAAAVRRQVGDAAHARAGALRAVVGVDGLGDAGRAGRPPRDALGARRAAARAPADPRAAPAGQRAHQARGPLRLHPLPLRHRVPDARGRRRSRRAGHAVNIGPLRGRHLAAELVEQLNSLFGLRHCGRKLPRRDHPSAYGQMGRCLSPCLHDLDPNVYRAPARRRRSRCSPAGGDAAGGGCSPTSTSRCARRRATQRFERAAWLRRRRERLAVLLVRARRRAGRDARAAAARAGRAPARRGVRRVLAGRRAGRGLGSADAARRHGAAHGRRRCARATGPGTRRGSRRRTSRTCATVGTWLASHPSTAELALAPAPSSADGASRVPGRTAGRRPRR